MASSLWHSSPRRPVHGFDLFSFSLVSGELAARGEVAAGIRTLVSGEEGARNEREKGMQIAVRRKGGEANKTRRRTARTPLRTVNALSRYALCVCEPVPYGGNKNA